MITLSTEHYPFVLASYRGDDYPEAMLRAMFDQMSEIARKSIRDGSHHVSVTLGGTNMNASHRKIVADLLAEFPAEHMERAVGSFVIVPNAAVRGALTALRWIAPKLAHVESVASVEEAVRAGAARLRERAIPIDDATLVGARRWLSAQARRNVAASPARA